MLRKYLENEKLHKINRAWKHLSPTQRAWIYIRAVWWSWEAPSVYEIVEFIQRPMRLRMTYRLYSEVHWVRR